MKLSNNRSLTALLLALALLLGLAAPAFAVEGDGTESTEPEAAETAEATESTEEPYETIYIQDAQDLLELAENCSLNTWSVGKLVVLQRDISLEDTDFLPIPSFGGVFDGRGHTISGLNVDAGVTPAGLFGRIQATGILRDLTVSGSVTPDGEALSVGGIAGENLGTILDCTFTGSVIGENRVGGIVGVNGVTGKIINCEAGGSVIGSDMTGGIAGYNLGTIGSSVNKASVNTVSVDPAVDPADINLDFLTDASKLTSLDTSSAARDTGGIAGYSSGIIEGCTNKASIGYPHIGYNVGGIAGRSCGYIHACENTAAICGRKDVGGIAGQMEPWILKNLTESALATLERQLSELDTLLDQAMEHVDDTMGAVSDRLNAIASSMGAAGAAAQDIRTTGTISGSVTGSGETGGSGSVTVNPSQAELGGSTGASGSLDVEVSPGSGSVDVSVGTGGEIHAGLTEGSASGEASASAGGSLDAQTQINITTSLSGLSSAIYGMAGQMSLLSGEISGASGDLSADVELIRAKISEITETAFDMILNDGEEDVIIDSSEIDIDLVTLGKTAKCVNSGKISGDINVGGIAGVMGMEYELDPEDDVTISIDSSARRKYEVKAIVQNCENLGAVTSKRNYAGGIVGKMDLGLIAGCESYGSAKSESGNYVGGIAGIASSTVRHCFVKCTLSGKKYIGGIVGSGVEEDRSGGSSTVAGCYAIVTITEYEQYAGAISGANAGVFLENYFVSGDLAGINRMSYTGEAEPLSYDDFIARFTADEDVSAEEASSEKTEETGEAEVSPQTSSLELPEEFRKFTLKFVVDGEVIQSEIFDYGASFGPETYPEVPQKEGYYGYWDISNLEQLKFDTTVTVVYEPYITALVSANARPGDQPTFFVEGQFAEGDQMTAEPMALTPGEFDLPESIWDAVCKCFTGAELTTEVVEQWRLQIPEDGQTTHTVRYLPPAGDVDRMDVYVRQNGRWVKAEGEVIGSYLAFQAEGNDIQIAVVSGIQVWWVWLIGAAVVLALILVILRLIRKFVKPGPKNPENPGEKAAPEAVPEPETVPAAEEKQSAVGVLNPVAVKKERRWLTPLLVVLALLVGIGGTIAFFLLPDLMAGKAAWDLLKAVDEKQELSMELQAEVTVGDVQMPISADIYRTTLDERQVTVICQDGKTLCYAEGAVYLENGGAYQIGTAFPDYSELLEQAMEVCQSVEIGKGEERISVTAEKENAKKILEILMPEGASFLSGTESLAVELGLDDGEVETITFSGSGTLNDEKKTSYSLSAVLALDDEPQPLEIPAQAAQAIRSGKTESLETLSGDVLRLVQGWQELSGRDPLAADLTLTADCGPIALNETLALYRWNTEDGGIFCVEENGYALYFDEEAICDSQGNTIPTAGASNLDAAGLLDIAYTLCMNAEASCTKTAAGYTYTISLDEAGMEQVAYAIAPEAEKLNISFDSGELILVMAGERIERMEVRISGSVQVVLSSADVSIGAKLEFGEEPVERTIPEAVEAALGA